MHDLHYRVNSQNQLQPITAIPSGLLHGLGVFTTFCLEGDGRVFYLENHYQRLANDCHFFGFLCPWPQAGRFYKLVEKIASTFQTPKPQVIRISLIPHDTIDLTTIEIIVSIRSFPPLKTSMRLKTCQFDRPFPLQKHMGRTQEAYYTQEAQKQGFDDILRLSSEGHICETSCANIFLLMPSSEVLTPDPKQSGCLSGIMRHQVITQLKLQGFQVIENTFTQTALQEASGLFLTNAVRGIIPIHGIDDKTYTTEEVKTLLARLKPSLHFRDTVLPMN